MTFFSLHSKAGAQPKQVSKINFTYNKTVLFGNAAPLDRIFQNIRFLLKARAFMSDTTLWVMLRDASASVEHDVLTDTEAGVAVCRFL